MATVVSLPRTFASKEVLVLDSSAFVEEIAPGVGQRLCTETLSVRPRNAACSTETHALWLFTRMGRLAAPSPLPPGGGANVTIPGPSRPGAVQSVGAGLPGAGEGLD